MTTSVTNLDSLKLNLKPIKFLKFRNIGDWILRKYTDFSLKYINTLLVLTKATIEEYRAMEAPPVWFKRDYIVFDPVLNTITTLYNKSPRTAETEQIWVSVKALIDAMDELRSIPVNGEEMDATDYLLHFPANADRLLSQLDTEGSIKVS